MRLKVMMIFTKYNLYRHPHSKQPGGAAVHGDGRREHRVV